MTWALSLLGIAGKAAKWLLGLVRDYPWQAAVAILLAACVWTWTGWNGALDDLRACQDGRAADRAAYEAAQEQAEASALAAKAAAEDDYRQLAERADREHEAELAGANARAERYIAANRVRNQAAGGPAGGTPAAPGDNGTGSGDRSSEAPELVTVTEDDIRICTENTVRLEAVRNWALELTD